MQKQILAELKELRVIVSKLIGSSDLPEEEQFSIEKINRAAKEFRKLFISREDWVSESDLYKYLKGTHYGAGKFIRKEFGFSNYFVQGNTHYYNRTDILNLAKALKERNVSLGKYIELRTSQDSFKKYLAAAAINKKASKKKFPYNLPDDLENITASESPKPSIELIETDLRNLEAEFFEYKLADYIDIFKNSYAMVKFEYSFSKYYPSEVKQRSKKWCERYNYANHALVLLNQKRPKFIPIKEDDMIQL